MNELSKFNIVLPVMEGEMEPVVFSHISNIDSALRFYIAIGNRFEKVYGQKHPAAEAIIQSLTAASRFTREDIATQIQIEEERM